MSVQHWESYYRSGGLATCPTAADGSYDQEVRSSWEQFFGDLAPGTRILDVGTGNGAIVLIAKEVADRFEKGFDIHGSDLAAIDPIRDVSQGRERFRGVTFHPETATESLPFEDGSFGAITGQYALEYMGEDAIGELHRVLGPGGRAQFILHHADSVLLRNARESLRHASLVREETAIHACLRRLIAAERDTPKAAREAADTMNQAAQTLHAAMSGSPSPLLLEVTLDAMVKLWESRHELSPTELEAEIGKVEADFDAAVRRLDDLVSHALTTADLDALLQRLGACGFKLLRSEAQYHAQRNLVGWRVGLERPLGVGKRHGV